MSPRRSVRRGSSRSGRRPRYRWGRFTLEAASLQAVTGSELTVILMAGSNTHEGHTLVRVIMDLNLTSGSADSGTYLWSIGMVLWPAEVGTQVLDPRDDAGPWLYLRQGAKTTVAGVSLGSTNSYQIDVRAQRKLSEQDELQLVLESGGMAGALNVDLQGRFLERIS